MADLRWTLRRSSRTTRDEVAGGRTLLVPGQSVEVVPLTKLANAEWRCKELEGALRGLAVRCESEAIEAAGDVAIAADIGDFADAHFQSGRRTAYNTVEAWIDNVLSDLRGHEQEEREK